MRRAAWLTCIAGQRFPSAAGSGSKLIFDDGFAHSWPISGDALFGPANLGARARRGRGGAERAWAATERTAPDRIEPGVVVVRRGVRAPRRVRISQRTAPRRRRRGPR